MIDPILFRSACGRYSTGIAILSTIGSDNRPHGLTVSSFTSVSLDPPLVSVCVNRASQGMLDHIHHHRILGVNILAEPQQHLASRFARRGLDRFEGVPWFPGQNGAPLLPDSLCVLECALEHTHTAGDHEILIAAVTHASVHEGRPLLYFASTFHALPGIA